MDKVLEETNDYSTAVYMDDIIVYSRTFDDHLMHLERVFQFLEGAKLKMGADKCSFCKTKIPFLGHIITPDGIRPNEALTTKVKDFPVPQNVTAIQSFLGLSGYYRQFIKNYAKIALPLIQLTRKDIKFEWNQECQKAFDYLKQQLTSEPILQFPDFKQHFILYTDASDFGLGAVLAQRPHNGKETVIGYASRTLNSPERNYNITEKECLAVIWATAYFHKFLYGQKFTIVTDHQALKVLNTDKTPKGRLARWKFHLAAYHYHVEHRKGTQHTNADALSRFYQPKKQLRKTQN